MNLLRRLKQRVSLSGVLFFSAVVILSLVSLPWLVGPPCPKEIVIVSGAEDGAYFFYAQKYKEILKRDGVDLQIVSTKGSVENLQILKDRGAEVAMLQGGIAQHDASEVGLSTIASLYQEPIWIFYRDQTPQFHFASTRGLPADDEEDRGQMTDLSLLHAKKIAIGPEGSGTRVVAETLLHATGIVDDETNFESGDASLDQLTSLGNETIISSLGGSDAMNALLDGELDAAFFVLAPESPIVRQLLEDEQISLMDFGRSTAYCRQLPFLSSAVLTEGVIDLEANIPSESRVLLAPTANLVCQDDLHPAIIRLLIKAAKEVHSQSSALSERGRFPNDQFADITMNVHASQFLESGPSPFYRYLPFSIAVSLDRIKLLILPLATLFFPIFKFAPPVYRWRIRSKVYRWYRVIREIEMRVKVEQDVQELERAIEQLQGIEGELDDVTVPVSFMSEFYEIRIHLNFVKERLLEQQRQLSTVSQLSTIRRAA